MPLFELANAEVSKVSKPPAYVHRAIKLKAEPEVKILLPVESVIYIVISDCVESKLGIKSLFITGMVRLKSKLFDGLDRHNLKLFVL